MALAWDSHVHHLAIRDWFASSAAAGWATCPVTESGFVRVSSNPRILPSVVDVPAARSVLEALRSAGRHRFLANDVSLVDADLPPLVGHAQVTDAVLLTVARRHGVSLVTFDAGLLALSGGEDVELLVAA